CITRRWKRKPNKSLQVIHRKHMSSPFSSAPLQPRPFSIPAKLHVFVSFMLQFTAAIIIIGILPSVFQQHGMSTLVAWLIAPFALIAAFFAIALIGRLIPVRCKQCSAAARYRGLGKWPFIYWYDCPGCGMANRYEVRGG